MVPGPPVPLDVDPETFRRLGRETVEFLVARLAEEVRDPVLAPLSAGELRAAWDAPPPRTGGALAEALAELEERLVPALRRNGHPRFFGYVCSSASPVGALADAIVSMLNQNVTAWRSAPGATEVERLVLRWLDELVGFGGAGEGLFVGGGSAANLTAVVTAWSEGRRRADLTPVRALELGTAYLSREAHLSLVKALRVLGAGPDNLRLVETDAGRALRPEALAEALRRDRAAGRVPLLVCATAGTANTGAVDPLEELASVAAEHGTWLHVDGAYGAPAALLPDHGSLRRGFARCDSLALDPHKWLFAPLDAGCLLVRDPEASRCAFQEDADYVRVHETASLESHAFFDRGLELSRRARALKVWLLLRVHGVDAIAEAIARNVALRERLDVRVAEEEELEGLGSGLSIACFRHVPGGRAPSGASDGEGLDAHNRRIQEALAASGRFGWSPTSVDGRFALRVCLVNFRTRSADVDELVDAVLAHGRAAAP